jgi:hypothetical protein
LTTAGTDAYGEQVKKQFEEIIDSLTLADLRKRYLRERWLDQLLWFERKAVANQRRYYALRLLTIVGGVIVPTIVSLNVLTDEAAAALVWLTFGVSLVVALAAALEGFFRYGERWRTYRRSAESLKAHGWQYFELTGPYALADHTAAFGAFARHVEVLMQQDLETYLAAMAEAQAAKAAADAAASRPAGGAAHTG